MKTKKPKTSTMIRVGLSSDEYAKVIAMSEKTGVSVARLTGDAIRKHLLKRAA